jgi:FAS-associated factor 2
LAFSTSVAGFLRAGPGTSPPRATNESAEQQADRFIRELEEETGALAISRAIASDGPSTSKAREAGSLSGRRLLPDFFVGGYEDALRTAKRDPRILCVVLVSSEHDDVPAFKQETLTSTELVTLLNDEQIIVWGGDVRNPDAYQAAIKLGVTTYPTVSFVALHPPRGRSNNNTSTSGASLHVFSHHAGAENCRPALLATHIRAVLLPRVSPFLTRVRTEEITRAEERRIREEQDRAYAEASARDAEKIYARRAEEARKAKEQREAEERKAKAQREAEERERLAMRREDNIAKWRATVRPQLLASGGAAGPIRLAIRLPQGARVMRGFAPDAPLASLYAYVDEQMVPASKLRKSFTSFHNPSLNSDSYSCRSYDGRPRRGIRVRVAFHARRHDPARRRSSAAHNRLSCASDDFVGTCLEEWSGACCRAS